MRMQPVQPSARNVWLFGLLVALAAALVMPSLAGCEAAAGGTTRAAAVATAMPTEEPTATPEPAATATALPPTPTPTPRPAPTHTPIPSPPPPTATPTPSVVTIGITNAAAPGAFSPATLMVAKGTQVKWHNTSGIAHTATSASGPASFDTGTIADQTTSTAITLSVTGTYTYKCSYHPSMTATIIVQ